jgi:hypothetical protein
MVCHVVRSFNHYKTLLGMQGHIPCQIGVNLLSSSINNKKKKLILPKKLLCKNHCNSVITNLPLKENIELCF